MLGRILFGLGALGISELKKFSSEKELIENIGQLSNEDLKLHMKTFENYQLKRIPFGEKYPKRMKKVATEILAERNIVVVDMGNGNIAVGRGKKIDS